ncbi:MAG: helix-turn-helix transcriptional regulator [Chloroflexi bacterium]|nr:helix-turn-helix transcriptional regulator [Chloroflexota bacterium]MBM4450697.1 helix-turn-helix transcriptional regulator [Chloroflexota bacterium]
MTRTYGHYCPVAHALEVVGDRWSLLIVRDLLNKPQRFSDLLRYSSSITPKWLMLRLRKLEEAGVIEREKRQDRREVWYKLTSAGYDLRPVVEALLAWGLRYAIRPPLPGEVVRPELAVDTLVASLNKRGRGLSQPATWLLHFTPGSSYTLSFINGRWSAREGEEDNPDVTVRTSPEAWATFLAVKRSECSKIAQTMLIDGTPERIEEFLHTFGVQADEGLRDTGTAIRVK